MITYSNSCKTDLKIKLEFKNSKMVKRKENKIEKKRTRQVRWRSPTKQPTSPAHPKLPLTSSLCRR
jgi:hypothetical protein